MVSARQRANQEAFLAAYEVRGLVSQASKDAGISRRNHYKWMSNDADYVERFEDAHEAFCETLEAAARQRAVEGVTDPIYWQGEEVGGKLKFSDSLLMFLLKGAMPDKYADRKQVSGPGGAPLEIVEEIIFVGDDDRKPLAESAIDDSHFDDDSGLF